MAVTHTQTTVGGGTTGTGNRAASITPAVNSLIIVMAVIAANTNNGPTCTDNNGGTYDLIAVQQWGSAASGDSRMSCFIRRELVAVSAATTVTVATGSNTSGEISLTEIAGVSRFRTGWRAARQIYGYAGSPNQGGQDNIANGGTPNPRLPRAALTDNFTICAVGSGLAAGSQTTPPTGWTERADAAQSSPTSGVFTNTRDSGFTGIDITWGQTFSPGAGFTSASISLEIDGTAPYSLADYVLDRGHISPMFWTPEDDPANEQNIVETVSSFILVNTSLGAG